MGKPKGRKRYLASRASPHHPREDQPPSTDLMRAEAGLPPASPRLTPLVVPAAANPSPSAPAATPAAAAKPASTAAAAKAKPAPAAAAAAAAAAAKPAPAATTAPAATPTPRPVAVPSTATKTQSQQPKTSPDAAATTARTAPAQPSPAAAPAPAATTTAPAPRVERTQSAPSSVPLAGLPPPPNPPPPPSSTATATAAQTASANAAILAATAAVTAALPADLSAIMDVFRQAHDTGLALGSQQAAQLAESLRTSMGAIGNVDPAEISRVLASHPTFADSVRAACAEALRMEQLGFSIAASPVAAATATATVPAAAAVTAGKQKPAHAPASAPAPAPVPAPLPMPPVTAAAAPAPPATPAKPLSIVETARTSVRALVAKFSAPSSPTSATTPSSKSPTRSARSPAPAASASTAATAAAAPVPASTAASKSPPPALNVAVANASAAKPAMGWAKWRPTSPTSAKPASSAPELPKHHHQPPPNGRSKSDPEIPTATPVAASATPRSATPAAPAPASEGWIASLFGGGGSSGGGDADRRFATQQPQPATQPQPAAAATIAFPGFSFGQSLQKTGSLPATTTNFSFTIPGTAAPPAATTAGAAAAVPAKRTVSEPTVPHFAPLPPSIPTDDGKAAATTSAATPHAAPPSGRPASVAGTSAAANVKDAAAAARVTPIRPAHQFGTAHVDSAAVLSPSGSSAAMATPAAAASVVVAPASAAAAVFRMDAVGKAEAKAVFDVVAAQFLESTNRTGAAPPTVQLRFEVSRGLGADAGVAVDSPLYEIRPDGEIVEIQPASSAKLGLPATASAARKRAPAAATAATPAPSPASAPPLSRAPSGTSLGPASAEAEAEREKGNRYYAGGDLDRALACYRRAAALAPSCAVYLSNLAACEYELGKYQQALATSQRAIEVADAEVARLTVLRKKNLARRARCQLYLGELTGVNAVANESGNAGTGCSVPAFAASPTSAAAAGQQQPQQQQQAGTGPSAAAALDRDLAQIHQAAKHLQAHEDFAAVDWDPRTAEDLRDELLTLPRTRASAAPPAAMVVRKPAAGTATAAATRPWDSWIRQGILGNALTPAISALSGVPYMIAPADPGAYPPKGQSSSIVWSAVAHEYTEHSPDWVSLGAGTMVDEDPDARIEFARWTPASRQRARVMFNGVDDAGRALWITVLDAAVQAARIAAAGTEKAGESASPDTVPTWPTKHAEPDAIAKQLLLTVHFADAEPAAVARALVMLAVLTRLGRALRRATERRSSGTERASPLAALHADTDSTNLAALAHYLCFGHLIPPQLDALFRDIVGDLLQCNPGAPLAHLPAVTLDRASWDRVRRVLALWVRDHAAFDATARARVLPRLSNLPELHLGANCDARVGGSGGGVGSKRTRSPRDTGDHPDDDEDYLVPDFRALHSTVSTNGVPPSVMPLKPINKADVGAASPQRGAVAQSPARPAAAPRSQSSSPTKYTSGRARRVSLSTCSTDATCPIGRFHHADMVPNAPPRPTAVSPKGTAPAPTPPKPNAASTAAVKATVPGDAASDPTRIQGMTVDEIDERLRDLVGSADTKAQSKLVELLARLPKDLSDAELASILESMPSLGTNVAELRRSLQLMEKYARLMDYPPRLFLDEVDDEQVWALYFRCLVPPAQLQSPEFAEAFRDWHCVCRHSHPRTTDPAKFAARFERILVSIASEWRANRMLLPNDAVFWSPDPLPRAPSVDGGEPLPSLASVVGGGGDPAAATAATASTTTSTTKPLPEKSTPSTSPTPAATSTPSTAAANATPAVPRAGGANGDQLPGLQSAEVFQQLVAQRWVWDMVESMVRADSPHPPILLFDWSAAFFALVADALNALTPDSAPPSTYTKDGRKAALAAGSPVPALNITMRVDDGPAALVHAMREQTQYDRVVFGGPEAHAPGWLALFTDAPKLLKPTAPHAQFILPPFPATALVGTIGIGGNRWALRAGPADSAVTATRPRPTLFLRHADECIADEFARAVRHSTRADSPARLAQILGVMPLVLSRKSIEHARKALEFANPELQKLVGPMPAELQDPQQQQQPPQQQQQQPSGAAQPKTSGSSTRFSGAVLVDYRWTLTPGARNPPAAFGRLAPNSVVASWLREVFVYTILPYADPSRGPYGVDFAAQNGAQWAKELGLVTPAVAAYLPERNFGLNIHGFFALLDRLVFLGYPRHWLVQVVEDLLAAASPTSPASTATQDPARWSTALPLQSAAGATPHQQQPAATALAMTPPALAKFPNWSPFLLDFSMAAARWLPALRMGIRVPRPFPSAIVVCVLPNVELLVPAAALLRAGAPSVAATATGAGLAGSAITASQFDSAQRTLGLLIGPAMPEAVTAAANERKLGAVRRVLNLKGAAKRASAVNNASSHALVEYIAHGATAAANVLSSATAAVGPAVAADRFLVPNPINVHVLSTAWWAPSRGSGSGAPAAEGSVVADIRFELPRSYLAAMQAAAAAAASVPRSGGDGGGDGFQILAVRTDCMWPVARPRPISDVVVLDE
ncbi:hypothetical protein H9P43_005929 [Blastocladiella emersonii ATCC 22665]|nr:hypothetical protein H9P43_005929 [Blastocladiella emersonii ATCC 22665]